MKLFAARECVFYYFILIKLSVDNQKIMNAIMNCNISNIDNCFVLICLSNIQSRLLQLLRGRSSSRGA